MSEAIFLCRGCGNIKKAEDILPPDTCVCGRGWGGAVVYTDNRQLQAENKCYREALENIHISAANVYGRDSQLAVLNLASIARQALENDND